tara:strand:- start:3965 stop:5122 length:1158 start_codon:yes stop_codon:yes gene_type:complete
MTVLKYYKSNEFNPVPINFSNKKSIGKHLLKRINLIERHLNINLTFLNNKDVLEFGPNGAENTCLFAINGCNIYLVEPHEKLHPLIKKNFQQIGKKNKLKLLSKKKIENFNVKKKFDIVIAEGFINTLNKRNFYVKKISKYLKNGGFLILNYDDVYGGFFEYLKSYVLLKVCYKKKINPKSQKGYDLALKLFKKEFDNLNKSRSFSSWWKDQLINPYASKIWSLNELFKLAKSLKLICHSNSPVFSNLNSHKWYKDVENKNFDYRYWNKIILNEWRKNYLTFFLGKKVKSKKIISEKLLKDIYKTTKKMNLMLLNHKLNYKVEIQKEFYEFLKDNDLKIYSKELIKLLKLLNSDMNNSNLIINYYLKSNISKTWGNLLHYVVFKK